MCLWPLRSGITIRGQVTDGKVLNGPNFYRSAPASHQHHRHQPIKINISSDDTDDVDAKMLQLLEDETDLDDSIVREIVRAASNQPSPVHRPHSEGQRQQPMKRLAVQQDKKVRGADFKPTKESSGCFI